MDTMQKMMMTIAAGRAERKMEAAGLTDEMMVEIRSKMVDVPEGTAEQLKAFKAEIGDEMFATIASGPSLMPALEEWRTNKGTANMAVLQAAIKEKVPDLEQEELEALLYLSMGGGQ